MSFGFPELTDSFLKGQDLLYTQFNDVSFYVEDVDQEYFYFHVLKKVFPNLSFQKIFPLNGKTNVVAEACQNVGNKGKVYIVDLDFDEILERKIDSVNLFYLDKYSIENYLIDKEAIYDLIKEHKTRWKDDDIELHFDYGQVVSHFSGALSDFAQIFLVIQFRSLGIEYFKMDPGRDFLIDNFIVRKKGQNFDSYTASVERQLKKKSKRYSLSSHVKRFKKHFGSGDARLKNIPGKYFLSLLKFALEKNKLINQMTADSFAVRLAKNCDFKKLSYLREEVSEYIMSK